MGACLLCSLHSWAYLNGHIFTGNTGTQSVGMRWANMKLSLAQLDASKVHLQKGPSRLLLGRLCASEQNVCFLWFGFVCKLLNNFLSLSLYLAFNSMQRCSKSHSLDDYCLQPKCRKYICFLISALNKALLYAMMLKSNTSDIAIFNLNCRTYICCLLLALTDL